MHLPDSVHAALIGHAPSKDHWITGAVKHPGAFTAEAKHAGKSVGQFAQEHVHASGKVGERARFALTMRAMHKHKKYGGAP